jgi:hypothetical protein
VPKFRSSDGATVRTAHAIIDLPIEERTAFLGHSFPTERSMLHCDIQSALTESWFKATDEFSSAIKAMTGKHISKVSESDFMLLRAAAEKARLASENARLMLELHRKEHGC